eukprot:symbB.v1.2.009802.t1/scaffold614.1/size180566/12
MATPTTKPLIGYNIAIKACQKQKDVVRACEILKEIQNEKLLPDIVSYTSAMRVCSSCAQWTTAMLLFSDLQRFLRVDLVAMNVAIHAAAVGFQWRYYYYSSSCCCCYYCYYDYYECLKRLQWFQPEVLFWQMLELQLLPDLVTFSSVLGALKSRWVVAMQMYQLMGTFCLRPDSVCYQVMLSAMATRWEQTLQFAFINNATGDHSALRTLLGCLEVSAAWHSSLQVLATLPNSITPGKIHETYKMTALQQGSLLLELLRRAKAEPDLLVRNAVSQRCAGQWQQAWRLLDQPWIVQRSFYHLPGPSWLWRLAIGALLRSGTLPNGVRHFNVAMDLCEKRGHWRFAVEVFEEISWRNLQRSVVSVGSVICALERSQQWQEAFEVYSQQGSRSPNMYGSMTSAFAREALGTLQESYCDDLPSEISLDAAIRACASASERQQGVALLWDAEVSGALSKTGLAFYVLSLARLNLRDCDVLRQALLEIVREVHAETAPQDLCSAAWSFATLGVRCCALLTRIAGCIGSGQTSNLKSFSWEELGVLCWSWVAISQEPCCDDQWWLLNSMQEEALMRLGRADYHDVRWGTFCQHILSMLWACSFGQTLSQRFLDAARGCLVAYGRSLETTAPGEAMAAMGMEEPVTVECDLMDRLVLYKPPFWEVHDGYLPSQLRTSLQKCFGTRYAILKDETHSYGFLHRLDVPSSGLVLAAKTYEVQLDVGPGAGGGNEQSMPMLFLAVAVVLDTLSTSPTLVQKVWVG